MNTYNIADSLAGKTYALGWDAVVAYDRQKINHFLAQQYVSKQESGTHFPPILFWENKKGTLRFENLILGAPSLSFEDATTQDSRVLVTLQFIGGCVIEKDTNHQVVNYIRIRPGMEFSIKLSIKLTADSEMAAGKGKILANFSKISIVRFDLNLSTELSAEAAQYFRDYFLENTVTYELGQLLLNDFNSDFTPKKFIIRTQCAPGATLSNASNYGDGAILLFVATEFNPKGGLHPTNLYPWLIPHGCSSAVLISNWLIVEHYIKPCLDKMLTHGKWELARGIGNNDAFYLRASRDAAMDHTSFIAQRDNNQVWCGAVTKHDNGDLDFIYDEFSYSNKDATFNFNTDTVEVIFDPNNIFVRRFGVQIYKQNEAGQGYFTYDTQDITFSIEGNIIYDLEIDSNNKSINFKLKSNNVRVNSDFKQKLDSSITELGDELMQKINDFLKSIYESFIHISFKEVNDFAVNKVRFPKHNINQLEAVSVPGDMIIFGNIVSDLTSLILSPLTSTILVGENIVFRTNTADDVTYTLSPKGAGHITLDGVYYAPHSISGGTQNVLVTATTAKSAASAYITVVSTPVLVSPAFIVLQEDNPHQVQFNVQVLGQNGMPAWTVTSSDPNVVGTIDYNGVYTPPTPIKGYPLGYTYITVTATASDGEKSQAYIMLVSNKTNKEFKVLPSFVRILPKKSHEFMAEASLDFVPDTWTHYPKLGTLSKVENDGDFYRVNYTAPDNLSGGEITIIRAIQNNKPHRPGYAVVELIRDIYPRHNKDNIK